MKFTPARDGTITAIRFYKGAGNTGTHVGALWTADGDQLREVVNAVKIPVQAVGGLSLEQAIQCPQYGAPLVVLGAPLTIDADAFKTADGNLEASLRMICEAVHAQDVPAFK